MRPKKYAYDVELCAGRGGAVGQVIRNCGLRVSARLIYERQEARCAKLPRRVMRILPLGNLGNRADVLEITGAQNPPRGFALLFFRASGKRRPCWEIRCSKFPLRVLDICRLPPCSCFCAHRDRAPVDRPWSGEVALSKSQLQLVYICILFGG